MWVLAVILIVLAILLIGFLFSPIAFYVDTEESRYEVSQLPVLKFFVSVQNGRLIPSMKLVGFNIPLKPKEKKPKITKPKKAPAEKKPSTRFHKSFATWRFTIHHIIKSFTIKRVILDLDTDDVVLNANLVPVFLLLSNRHVTLNSNFSGRAYFHLEAENKPIRLLWIFIQFLTKK